MAAAADASERLSFWLYPSAYTTPERLAALEPGLPPALAERLLAAPRLAARLSGLILRRAGLGAGPPPPEGPAFALARLPAAELLSLARACGAVLHHAAVRSVVLRAQRQRLRALLGVDAHELALKRAPFLRLPTRPVPPEDELEAVIERDGLACLRARFAGEPEGLADRAGLKLPPGGGFDYPDPVLSGDAGRRVIARVFLEGDPGWRAFSS